MKMSQCINRGVEITFPNWKLGTLPSVRVGHSYRNVKTIAKFARSCKGTSRCSRNENFGSNQSDVNDKQKHSRAK